MSTSDGISTADWDRVHELAVDLCNALETDEEDRCRHRLMDWLQELERKYGERPSLLATRGDFSRDMAEKERLLSRAYDLSQTREDRRNSLYVAHSLAELYVEDLKDGAKARLWLDRLRREIGPRDDGWIAEEHARLRDLLEDV